MRRVRCGQCDLSQISSLLVEWTRLAQIRPALRIDWTGLSRPRPGSVWNSGTWEPGGGPASALPQWDAPQWPRAPIQVLPGGRGRREPGADPRPDSGSYPGSLRRGAMGRLPLSAKLGGRLKWLSEMPAGSLSVCPQCEGTDSRQSRLVIMRLSTLSQCIEPGDPSATREVWSRAPNATPRHCTEMSAIGALSRLYTHTCRRALE